MIFVYWMLISQSPSSETPKSPDLPYEEVPMASDVQKLNQNFTYSYNPLNKRDPFRSYLLDAGQQDLNANPLLNYDLSKFILTGIVSGIANPRAVVVDGGGQGHIISRGTLIGRNRGRVTKILKDQIIVTEEFRDPLGKLVVSEFSIRLQTSIGERK